MIVFSVLFSMRATAMTEGPLIRNIDDWQGRYLGRVLSYWRGHDDPKIAMSQENADKYQQGSQDLLSFGVVEDSIWYRLVIDNSSSQSRSIFINIPGTFGSTAAIYQDGELVARIAESSLFFERYAVLHIEAGQQSIIHIQNYSSSPHLVTWKFFTSEAHLIRHFADQELVIVGTFVVGFMTILFNLMLLHAYRRWIYLYYVLYIASFLLLTLQACNLISQAWLSALSMLSLPSMPLFGTLFSRDFLDLNQAGAWLRRIIQLTIWALLALIVLMLFNSGLATSLLNVLSPFTTPVLLMAGIIRVLQRQTYALLYVLGFGTMLVGAILATLRYSGLLIFDGLSPWIFWYAVGIENILLLLAIGRQISLNEKSRKKNHQAVKQNLKTIQHHIHQLSKVFYPHQVQMMKSGKELEETMPIGSSNAFIISLDVMGSSEYSTNEIKAFLREAFTACGSAMMENYDGDTLSSNAFRLKEMGDGFVCSVGFPFRPPANQCEASTSYELAKKFIRIFQQTQEKYRFTRKVHCAIAIAFDEVQGSFSWSLPIEYDLFGRGLILAKRYEQLRKSLDVLQLPDRHLLVIHEKVFERLPAQVKSDFLVFNLAAHQQKVRDDPAAQHFYYQFFVDQAG